MSDLIFASEQLTDGGGGNEADEPDIVVIGTREKKDISPQNRLVAQFAGGGGGWPGPADVLNWVARKFREAFEETSIDAKHGGFDQHHQDIIAQVMAKLASSKMFKDAWNHMQQQHLSIEFKQFQSPSDLGDAQGRTRGVSPDKTVNDGAFLQIQITINRGGEPISDKLFATTVLHEIIHAFGDPAWSTKLDDTSQHWDEQLYRELFSDHLATDSQQILTDIAHVAFSTEGGGAVSGDATHGILVGSVSADTFFPGRRATSFCPATVTIRLRSRSAVAPTRSRTTAVTTL